MGTAMCQNKGTPKTDQNSGFSFGPPSKQPERAGSKTHHLTREFLKLVDPVLLGI